MFMYFLRKNLFLIIKFSSQFYGRIISKNLPQKFLTLSNRIQIAQLIILPILI